eukprot:6970811-Prymnesium_polylepis.1
MIKGKESTSTPVLGPGVATTPSCAEDSSYATWNSFSTTCSMPGSAGRTRNVYIPGSSCVGKTNAPPAVVVTSHPSHGTTDELRPTVDHTAQGSPRTVRGDHVDDVEPLGGDLRPWRYGRRHGRHQIACDCGKTYRWAGAGHTRSGRAPCSRRAGDAALCLVAAPCAWCAGRTPPRLIQTRRAWTKSHRRRCLPPEIWKPTPSPIRFRHRTPFERNQDPPQARRRIELTEDNGQTPTDCKNCRPARSWLAADRKTTSAPWYRWTVASLRSSARGVHRYR